MSQVSIQGRVLLMNSALSALVTVLVIIVLLLIILRLA
jgi:hypothetical protein